MYRGVPTYLGATHACYFLFQMCVHPPRIMYVSSFSMPLLYHVICLFSHAWFANWTKTMTMSLQSHTMLPFLFIFLSFGHKLKNQFQKRTQNTTNPDKPMQPKWKDQKIKTICNLFFRVTTKLLHVKRLHVLPLMWTVVATTCLKQPIGVPYPFPYELLVMWLQGPKPLLCLWEKKRFNLRQATSNIQLLCHWGIFFCLQGDFSMEFKCPNITFEGLLGSSTCICFQKVGPP